MRRERALSLDDVHPEPCAPAGGASEAAAQFAAATAKLLGELEPGAGSADERLRQRITSLIDRAQEAADGGRLLETLAALELAFREDPSSVVTQKTLHGCQRQLCVLYSQFLGDAERRPVLALAMSELPMGELDHRAAFLLSRLDGTMTIDELLSVAGMPEIEALRHLSRFVLQGIVILR